jgi:alanine-glyoxylate transaminase/serine-glyoxylate transaminase/serine-pyruvate transaminase
VSATAPTPATAIPAFDPPVRLLAGPGPSNVDPRVRAAMDRPLISHLDPVFWDRLPVIAEMVGRFYGRTDGASLCLSASGTSGMEAGILNLVAPGDTVVAASAGFFGNRIIEMLRRRGADIVGVRAPYGRHVPNEEIMAAVEANPQAVMVCVVHAETSTGVEHPIAELGAMLRASGSDALLFADCVTALGGIPVEVDACGIDYAYSCSQKCLAAPPGLSPITLSSRAIERLGRDDMPVPYSLDLAEHLRYWADRPMTYHHTTPNLQYYALDEALRLGLEEGLEARFARHAAAGAHLQSGFRARGFDLLADPARQLPQLTAVRVPEGVDGKAVQAELLSTHGIEVGGGLGPDAPPIWRIGMMGVNADPAVADRVLAAFDAALPTGAH